MEATKTPAPGSDDALDIGCICPVLDNGHGWGYIIKGQYVIHGDCPIHSPVGQQIAKVI